MEIKASGIYSHPFISQLPKSCSNFQFTVWYNNWIIFCYDQMYQNEHQRFAMKGNRGSGGEVLLLLISQKSWTSVSLSAVSVSSYLKSDNELPQPPESLRYISDSLSDTIL